MRRENKREEILQAAMRVFCHYGYDGATLEKIAGEAGVSKGLVIKYYRNLRELLILCLTRFLTNFLDKLERNARRAKSTYVTHLEYVFSLAKLSRPQLRLTVSLLLTPAHEEITRMLIPACLHRTQDLLQHFPETRDHPQGPALNYTMYALLVTYTIGGNEANYRNAREEALRHFLPDFLNEGD